MSLGAAKLDSIEKGSIPVWTTWIRKLLPEKFERDEVTGVNISNKQKMFDQQPIIPFIMNSSQDWLNRCSRYLGPGLPMAVVQNYLKIGMHITGLS